MEFVVADFGPRLRAVREARGFKKLADLARHIHGSDSRHEAARTQFLNYLSRVERESISVGLDYQLVLAKGLGFPSLSAFWIAIEQAGTHESSVLLSTLSQTDNAASPASSKADPDAHPLPTVADLERVFMGSAEIIVHALDRLAERLSSSVQPAASPRPDTPDRRRTAHKRSG